MDIKRYEFEITTIINESNNLKNGCFYENDCRANQGNASAKRIAENVKIQFIELMDKIAKDKPGMFGE